MPRPTLALPPGRLRATVLAALLLAACAAGSARAQAPSAVRLYVLADTVEAGERFLVALAADRPAGTQALFPPVPPGDPADGPLARFGDAEAFDVQRFAPRLRGRTRTDSLVYTVAAFAADAAAVGPFEVRVVAGEDTARARSGVGRVAIRAHARAEGTPAAPVRSPEPFAPLWPLVALAGALAALVAFALHRRRRRRREPETPRAAPLPEALAHIEALEVALARAPAAGPPDARAHFAALSDALRVYLARRLGVPATEMTTAELDAALRTTTLGARVPEASWRALRGVLRLADLAKFAGLRPDAASTAEAHARARDALRTLDAALAEAEARAEARAAGPHADEARADEAHADEAHAAPAGPIR
ncbi:MAG: hypothetical protein ACK41D_10435 [Rubricoccaceae bacterium]